MTDPAQGGKRKGGSSGGFVLLSLPTFLSSVIFFLLFTQNKREGGRVKGARSATGQFMYLALSSSYD